MSGERWGCWVTIKTGFWESHSFFFFFFTALGKNARGRWERKKEANSKGFNGQKKKVFPYSAVSHNAAIMRVLKWAGAQARCDTNGSYWKWAVTHPSRHRRTCTHTHTHTNTLLRSEHSGTDIKRDPIGHLSLFISFLFFLIRFHIISWKQLDLFLTLDPQFCLKRDQHIFLFFFSFSFLMVNSGGNCEAT